MLTITPLLVLGVLWSSPQAGWTPQNVLIQMGGSVSSVSLVTSETVTATDTDTWSRIIESNYEESTFASTTHGASVKTINSGTLLDFVQNSYNGSTGTFSYTATIRAKIMATDTEDIFVDTYDITDGNAVQVHKDNGFVVQWSVIVAGPTSGGGGGSGL